MEKEEPRYRKVIGPDGEFWFEITEEGEREIAQLSDEERRGYRFADPTGFTFWPAKKNENDEEKKSDGDIRD